MPKTLISPHIYDMSVLSGSVHVTLAGERRALNPDLNMGAVLFDRIGSHWLLWLAERWLGSPTRLDGRQARKLEPTRPEELALVLYALLQTDRELAAERGELRNESEVSVRRSVTLANMQDVQTAVAKAILSCFLTPGESEGLDVRVDGEAPGSAHAQTSGTGLKSLRSRLH